MMLILKLPIVYLIGVVWWAIRAEPRPPEGAALLAAPEADGPSPWRRHPVRPRPGPHGRRPRGAPTRTYARRPAFARARLDRT
jgi:hypothetical protein